MFTLSEKGFEEMKFATHDYSPKGPSAVDKLICTVIEKDKKSFFQK